jgi:hypothetical protein
MRELIAENEPPVEGQHVITRKIVKRFSAHSGDDAGKIAFVCLEYPHVLQKPRGPRGCGKIENFVTIASASMERRWQNTETKLHDALQAVDDGTILQSQRHAATIKDTIALHYARSLAVREVNRWLWQWLVPQQRTQWLTDPILRQLLIREFYRRHGLLPGGLQALEELLDDAMASSIETGSSGAQFRESIESTHSQAMAWVNKHELEILTPGSGEFLIGDVPVLTVRHDTHLVGVHGGIALGDAHAVFMPLGPRHIASVVSSSRTAELTPELVCHLNALQVRGAMKYVYMRPGSGLESFVRQILGAEGQSASA